MPWLIVALLVTAICVYLGRSLAAQRGRRVFAWGLAVALFPPLILVLALLPANAVRDEVSAGC